MSTKRCNKRLAATKNEPRSRRRKNESVIKSKRRPKTMMTGFVRKEKENYEGLQRMYGLEVMQSGEAMSECNQSIAASSFRLENIF